MRLHNRVVKAGFWTDTDLLRIKRDIRNFYQGLWQLADDSGCIENDPFAFKIHLYPSPLDSDITIEVIQEWVVELTELGKLIPYSSNGKECLYIKNFHKHQTLRSPAPPDVPLPLWIQWVPSEKSRRSGEYIVNNPYGDLTVTVGKSNGDQPEPEIEPEKEIEINNNDNARAKDEPVETVDNVDNLTSIAKFIEKEFGQLLTSTCIMQINDWQNHFPDEMIKYAVQKAVLQNCKNYAYVNGIINGWLRKGIKTLLQAKKDDEDFGQKKNKASPRVNNGSVKTGTLNYIRDLNDLVE